LKNHEKLCHQFETQKAQMPTNMISGKQPYTNFRNHAKMFKMEYVIYADFEDSELADRSEYQNHTPCDYRLVAVDVKQRKVLHDVYRGPDCIDRFISKIDSICNGFVKQIERRVPMDLLKDEEQDDYDSADTCHICLTALDEDKVRDHEPRNEMK
jgi:hypothetical protein